MQQMLLYILYFIRGLSFWAWVWVPSAVLRYCCSIAKKTDADHKEPCRAVWQIARKRRAGVWCRGSILLTSTRSAHNRLDLKIPILGAAEPECHI
jgi:hypothetical protein